MAGPWDTGCVYQGRVMMFPTGLTRMYDPASVICSTVSNATRAAGKGESVPLADKQPRGLGFHCETARFICLVYMADYNFFLGWKRIVVTFPNRYFPRSKIGKRR
ncbi:hypothetical protein ASPFODRAFT_55664 [Aspergillus luchuensis CBS 106.47]|uniref:Uncharacterized protein n=1 Tax=Aspergillus luchuensis (strain CBS 106.47) TaxID=1137211 RepID=A0A1M3TYZ2_ASPLC|nr:hypothetical protein ASPFODRAFT_55664 [Aspergillus luchuensis CBS 106.47]